jgi:hypothetical protein
MISRFLLYWGGLGGFATASVSLWILRLKQITERTLGHPKTKDRVAGRRPERQGRQVVICGLHLPSSFVYSPVGHLHSGSPLAVGIGVGPPSASSRSGIRMSVQVTCLTLSLVLDDMEVCWCVEMVGSLVHAHPSCHLQDGPTHFTHSYPNIWKEVLNLNTNTPSPTTLTINP